MSGKLKPSRLITSQPAESPKKIKFPGNLSLNRYSRDLILSKYLPEYSFPIPVPEDISLLYLTQSECPCVGLVFEHNLSDPINSRPKKLEINPETPKKKPEKTPKKLRLKQKSEGLLLTTEKITIHRAKNSYETLKHKEDLTTIFMVPVYEKQLLSDFADKGNPFANAMIQTGINAEDGKIYFPLGLRPYERVWYYRDPQGEVQGPFSCIEMFNWTLRGCFPQDLEISFAKTEFIPMNEYLNEKRGINSKYLEDIKEE